MRTRKTRCRRRRPRRRCRRRRQPPSARLPSPLPVVQVDGHELKLSNLDKVLYPETGFTKGEVIDYYARIAPVLLAHCADRFVTRKRYPNGVDSTPFFEKNCPKHKPDWIGLNEYHGSDGDIAFCRIDSVAAVVWLANLAALELHTSMSRAVDLDTPTMVVFDLDPGDGVDVLGWAEVGLWLPEGFDHLGLQSVIKTSGSKGLQAYGPLNTPVTHDDASDFSHGLARLLEREHPDRVVSVQRKELRGGKVLVDWSQNSRHKTTVCAYSLRA